MKLNKKLIQAFLLIIIIGLAAFLILDETFSFSKSNKNSTLYSYSSFHTLVEEGKIESAEISKNKIKFSVKDDSSTYVVENPNSPTLKEFLLLNNVAIKEEKDTTEILSLVMDYLFYGIFFCIIGFVFIKFISPNTFKVVKKTGKTFKDVVGMEKLKTDMYQIMDIMKNPKEWAKKGVKMPKGILLEGEPGNGKTLFAKAMAGEAKVNFIPAKATDFESMFMAIGPMKVKLLFKKARRKAPCIVFIDEFDGIGTKRNYSGSAIETENTRIVTALLNELDGFQQNQGILVLAATNSISALDEALIRPGRFDAKVTVPYPDEDARKKLIEMYSAGKNMSTDCSPKKLSPKFKGFSCAKIETVLNKAALLSAQNKSQNISLTEIESAIKEC